nr:hypothetical protein [uncultured Mucilaginibacter sp.]
MKKLAILLCVLFVACSGDKPGRNYNRHDASVIIKDTTIAPIVQKTSDPVALIRQQVEHINTAKITTEHIEFMCDEKTKVDYYYENKVPVKIAVDFGWVGDAHAKEDYYFNRSKLIFVYQFTEGGAACEGCIKTNEYRSYVSNDKVVKYLKNKDDAQCKRCEFGQLSEPYQLLMTSTAAEARKILCK